MLNSRRLSLLFFRAWPLNLAHVLRYFSAGKTSADSPETSRLSLYSSSFSRGRPCIDGIFVPCRIVFCIRSVADDREAEQAFEVMQGEREPFKRREAIQGLGWEERLSAMGASLRQLAPVLAVRKPRDNKYLLRLEA